ncbi:MAG: hypothetical protein IT376_09965 [Polyangiaceae bacterium]|nr:hypothetical protein [Polyangiaceae bacterium]
MEAASRVVVALLEQLQASLGREIVQRRIPGRLRGWLEVSGLGRAGEPPPGSVRDLLAAVDVAFGAGDGRVWASLGRELHEAVGARTGSEPIEQDAEDALAFARHFLGPRLTLAWAPEADGRRQLTVAVEGEPSVARVLAQFVTGWLAAGDVAAGAGHCSVEAAVESVGARARLTCWPRTPSSQPPASGVRGDSPVAHTA